MPGQRRIVAGTFVAKECMGSVYFVPLVVHAILLQPGMNQDSTRGGNMRVLPSPDVQDFALDFAGTLQGVIVLTLSEASRVQIGGVKAGCRQIFAIHGGAK